MERIASTLRLLVLLVGLFFTNGAQPDPETYFGAVDNEAYLEWLASVTYERTEFLPAPSGDSTGAALHWTIRDDQIFLAVAAKATGWVGFGIAESGGMYGSDTVIYTASTDSLIDGHILDERLVFPDECQSWTLLNSVNEGGFLIFEASRLLDTGDTQDHPIVQDGDASSVASRVITAWSDTESNVSHGPNNRAATSLRFYGTGENGFDAEMGRDSEGSIELRANDYPVKEQDTEYAHFCFSFADLVAQGMPADTSLHSIGFEPIIDPRATKYVHHFVLSASSTDAPVEDCENALFLEIAYAWGPGEGPMTLPPNAGGPLGGDDGFRAFRLQIHYNNPWLDPGIVDSSGVRVYFTSNKREHDMGMLQLGDPTIRLANQVVGPAKHTFDCPSSCSKAALTEPVTVVRENLHMHQKGLTMRNDHIRDGKVIRSAQVQFYDFEQQGAYAVQQEPYEILPGDSFKTSCEYLSSDTIFGTSSQEEMCMVFVGYYPRQTRSMFGLEVGYVCGYQLPIPDCAADWEQDALESDADLSRTFGTPSETCSIDGSGGDGNSGIVEGTNAATSGAYYQGRFVSDSICLVVVVTLAWLGIM